MHILASPAYAPATNVTCMKKRIQHLSNASQHVPIYLQPFPSNSTRKFKSSQFLHILASPGYAPGTIAVNVTGWKKDSILVKRIAAYTHLYSTVYEL